MIASIANREHLPTIKNLVKKACTAPW